jgi:hypothetical protein
MIGSRVEIRRLSSAMGQLDSGNLYSPAGCRTSWPIGAVVEPPRDVAVKLEFAKAKFETRKNTR